MKSNSLQLWVSAACILARPALAAYHWPSPQFDAVEALLYELSPEPQLNTIAIPLTDRLNNCQRSTFDNSSTAAQWLRYAFNDMATHNVDDGTGGLDASVVFELGRGENTGTNMVNTMRTLNDFAGEYVSRADVIAIGTVVAVAECGGPTIPYRMGRVDALAAGAAGVPQPQQDLATHIESFRKQGFTQSEMIGLVACGHTLGGVRSNDFPNIIPNDPFSNGVIKDFDTTPTFDSAIVTEYLNGTSQDPLVVVTNKALASDIRIFSSDNNVTMKSMATPKTFATTCQGLLERMINTVPNGVVLSDVIRPLPVKVDAVQLSVANNSLNLQAMLRLATANPKRKVTMRWENRIGGTCKGNRCSAGFVNTTDTTTELTRRAGMSPQKYYFNTPINVNTSISKFWFEVDEGHGKNIVLDNGGTGYQIEQDRILFDAARSSINFTDNSFTITAAVRSDSAPSRVFANVMWRTQPTLSDETIEFQLATGIPATAGYTFYQGQLSHSEKYMFDLFSEVNGTTYKQEGRNSVFIPVRSSF